jgi:hypothetical protein
MLEFNEEKFLPNTLDKQGEATENNTFAEFEIKNSQEESPKKDADTHEARREELYQNIEKKVALAGELRQLIVISEIDDTNVGERISEIDSLVQITYPEAYQTARELQHCRAQDIELREKIEAVRIKLSQDPVVSKERDEFSRAFNVALKEDDLLLRYQLNGEKLDEIDKDNMDVVFCDQMQKVLESLRGKNELVTRYKEHPELLRAEFERVFDEPYDESNIEDIVFSSFDVSFVMKPGFQSKRTGGRVWGCHFPNTPINYISSASGNLKNTIRHEGLHNVFDASEYVRRGDVLTTIQERRGELYSQWWDGATKKFTAKQLIDDVHEETVASIEGGEMNNFERITSSPEDPSEDNLQRQFEAAGMFIRRGTRYAETLKKDPNMDEPTRKRFEQLQRDMEKEVINIFKLSVPCVQAANDIGEDASFDAHALIAILKPSKYKRIASFLELKYGERFTRALEKRKREFKA